MFHVTRSLGKGQESGLLWVRQWERATVSSGSYYLGQKLHPLHWQVTAQGRKSGTELRPHAPLLFGSPTKTIWCGWHFPKRISGFQSQKIDSWATKNWCAQPKSLSWAWHNTSSRGWLTYSINVQTVIIFSSVVLWPLRQLLNSIVIAQKHTHMYEWVWLSTGSEIDWPLV